MAAYLDHSIIRSCLKTWGQAWLLLIIICWLPAHAADEEVSSITIS